MIISFKKRRTSFTYKLLCSFIALTFSTSVILPPAYAQSVLNLPVPGTMVSPSSGFAPALMTGITIHPDNPLRFDFIMDRGQSGLANEPLKEEYTKMIKYFMASLTVPEDQMWVNLSPYEKDRMITKGLGQTEMGRDMLAQDYLLKQLTASLMYPEKELGKKFWDRIYKKAKEQFGTTDIPVNTFNKVWIVPDQALVYEQGSSAFVIKSRLKVMLEQDYVASQHNPAETPAALFPEGKPEGKQQGLEVTGDAVTTGIIREIIIPAIEVEVNEGKNFANLRQIYNALILATWYKQRLKDSLLGKVYVDQNKTKGIDTEDKQINQKIYDQYIESFKKGVYNFIKEDIDPATQEIIPRKYFSGGLSWKLGTLKTVGAFALGTLLSFGSPDVGNASALTAAAMVGTRDGVTTELVDNGQEGNIGTAITVREGGVQPLLLVQTSQTLGGGSSSSPVENFSTDKRRPDGKSARTGEELSAKLVKAWYETHEKNFDDLINEVGERDYFILLEIFAAAKSHQAVRAVIGEFQRTMSRDEDISQATGEALIRWLRQRGALEYVKESEVEPSPASSPVTLEQIKDDLNKISETWKITNRETLAARDAVVKVIDDGLRDQKGVTLQELYEPLTVFYSHVASNTLFPATFFLQVQQDIGNLDLGGPNPIVQLNRLKIGALVNRSLEELTQLKNTAGLNPDEIYFVDTLSSHLTKLGTAMGKRALVFGLFYHLVIEVSAINSRINKDAAELPVLNGKFREFVLQELVDAAFKLQFGGYKPPLTPLSAASPVRMIDVREKLGGSGNQDMVTVPFNFDIWLGAGQFKYKVWKDADSGKVFFQRFHQNKEEASPRKHEIVIGEAFSVGRDPLNNSYSLADPLLFRSHFRIIVNIDRSSMTIEDRGSTNGTDIEITRMERKLDGKEIEEFLKKKEQSRDGIYIIDRKELFRPLLTVLSHSVDEVAALLKEDRVEVVELDGLDIQVVWKAQDSASSPVEDDEWGDILPQDSFSRLSYPDQPVKIERSVLGDGSALVTYHKDGIRYIFRVEKGTFAAINQAGFEVDRDMEGFKKAILASPQVSEEIKRWVETASPPSAIKIERSALGDGIALVTYHEDGIRYIFRVREGTFAAFTERGIGVDRDMKDFKEKILASPQVPEEIKEWVRISNPGASSPVRQIDSNLARPRQDFQSWRVDNAQRAETEAQPPGGIDLNPALLDLQIRRDGNGVPLPLPQQPVETMHIDGFLPVIINITPISNLPLVLGLADTGSDTQETRPALKASQGPKVPFREEPIGREIEPVSLLN